MSAAIARSPKHRNSPLDSSHHSPSRSRKPTEPGKKENGDTKKHGHSEKSKHRGHKGSRIQFKLSWLWKYGPIVIMAIAMGFAWLHSTPEGRQINATMQKNAEDLRAELNGWLSEQVRLYEESISSTRDRIAQSIITSLEPDSPAQIGWALSTPEHEHTKNRTTHFWEIYNSPLETPDLMPKDLENDLFLYIPGLFTQWYPGYMGDLIKGMKALNYDAFFCTLNTAASMEDNAHIIAANVRNLTRDYPGRKVMILGHSKGALDTATAFILHPDIIPSISAFIAFQAPWGGSTIANDILSAHNRRAVSSAFIEKVLNGDPISLTGIMYHERQRLAKLYPFPLGAVPTISVATYETSFRSLLKASIDYVQLRYNEKSDGCVATNDAIIPGTILVELPGLDHFGPAYHGFPACCAQQNPLRIQMVLLSVLLHN